MAKIFTIGFSGKKPDVFMDILNATQIHCVWDIRLWRTSTYVPFYSGENLATTLGAQYEYHPEFAPTAGLTPDTIDRICLLCTEKSALQCHRRLAAEYIATQFPVVEIVHL